VERYLRDPGFVVETSFGAYLDYQIRSTLYNYKEQRADQCESIHALESGEDRVGDAELAFTGSQKLSSSKKVEHTVSRSQLNFDLRGLLYSSHAMIDFHLDRETSMLFLLSVKGYLYTRFLKKKSQTFETLYGNREVIPLVDGYLNDMFQYLKSRGKL
jgi:hypothetical protein